MTREEGYQQMLDLGLEEDDELARTTVKQTHPTEAEPTFEQAMLALEDIVRSLESGDLPLEEAIAAYQRAIELSRICRRKLDEAEQKIETLVADDGWSTKKPFEPEEQD